MEQKNIVTGHLSALISILIWGTTFSATKTLLKQFTPVEIMFFRLSIAFIALRIVYPHSLKVKNLRRECLFAAAGLCGVTLYFLLEIMALTYSTASNVGIIISIAPFFTAILARIFLKEKLKPHFLAGFVVAITGIIFIAMNGRALKLNPIGDVLTIAAAISWASYSLLVRKIAQYGYHTIQTTRRIFGYGIFFMIPALIFFKFQWGLERFSQPLNVFNVVYLGLGASAFAFVSWNVAVKYLGAVKTSAYIYAVPVVTLITSVIVLHEKITWIVVLGTILTLLGLVISESKLPMFVKKRS